MDLDAVDVRAQDAAALAEDRGAPHEEEAAPVRVDHVAVLHRRVRIPCRCIRVTALESRLA